MWPRISSFRILAAASSTSSGVSAKSTPPAFMRPPESTCDFTTTGPPIPRAVSPASAAVAATLEPAGRGIPRFANSAFDSYS
jgi:hypothetical protein